MLNTVLYPSHSVKTGGFSAQYKIMLHLLKKAGGVSS